MLEASPMPTPPRMRHMTKAGKDAAKAMPSDETTKFAAAAMRIGLRPKRSLSAPDASAPARQPSKAQLCAHPIGDTALATSFCQNVASAETAAAVSVR